MSEASKLNESRKPLKTYEDLKGIEKAAVLLLSVKEEITGSVFKNLEDSELKDLSQAMCGLGVIKSEIVDEIYKDFMSQIASTSLSVGLYLKWSIAKTTKNIIGTNIMHNLIGFSKR